MPLNNEGVFNRGGVLEDTVLKSLASASRPQVLKNWPVLGSRTALFFELLKFCGALEKFFGKRFKRFFVEIAWKIFVKTFFFLESTCPCVLGPWPWPRAFLSLASRVSVLGKAVLGLGLGFFLCRWPWARALGPRLHLWFLSCGFNLKRTNSHITEAYARIGFTKPKFLHLL